MKRKTAGFSLIELIVVIAILAVLVGILAPSFVSKIEAARRSRDMANAKQIEKVLTFALSSEQISIPERLRSGAYGAWVMICNKDKSNAPVPYHTRNFTGGWCGVDKGVFVNGNKSVSDTAFNNDLADVLKESGIDVTKLHTISNGNAEGWDWIIIEVFYDQSGAVSSKIYSGYKTEDGGINKTTNVTNIEKLMYGK